MNPTSLDEAKRIFAGAKRIAPKLSSTSIVICPPFVYLGKFLPARLDLPFAVGAQDAYFENQGHFTGEISPAMLKDLGVEYVIVGHSERRLMGETDELISKKVNALLDVGIHPILCVGEEKRDDQGLYLDLLKIQIKNSLAKVQKKFAGQIIVAYEPVWAIGVKEAMDPALINETVIYIKKILSDIFGHENGIGAQVVYGGSVNFRNVAQIMELGGVNGVLLGRESVNLPGFTEILKAVDLSK